MEQTHVEVLMGMTFDEAVRLRDYLGQSRDMVVKPHFDALNEQIRHAEKVMIT